MQPLKVCIALLYLILPQSKLLQESARGKVDGNTYLFHLYNVRVHQPLVVQYLPYCVLRDLGTHKLVSGTVSTRCAGRVVARHFAASSAVFARSVATLSASTHLIASLYEFDGHPLACARVEGELNEPERAFVQVPDLQALPLAHASFTGFRKSSLCITGMSAQPTPAKRGQGDLERLCEAPGCFSPKAARAPSGGCAKVIAARKLDTF